MTIDELRRLEQSHLIKLIDDGILTFNNVNDYQIKAMRTANMISQEDLILNGTLGLSGESGEVADIVKKALFQGHNLDKKHIAEELGDICWYVAITAKGIGYSLSDIMQMNIDKLMSRYPKGFDKDKSINRNNKNMEE